MTCYEQIRRIDDLTGETGAEPARFALDDPELLIDLHPRNAQTLR